jgi:hypothetical protein
LLVGEGDVTVVADARRLPCLLASLAEDGEQNRRQDRNYRNHDQQLNEGETTPQHHLNAPPFRFPFGQTRRLLQF